MLSSSYSSISRLRCTWSSPPVKIRSFPWPGYAPEGSLDRIACHRPALYSRRSRHFPQPGDGPGSLGRRNCCSGDPYRRLDCRAPTGSTLDAGAQGHSCVHSGIRWRQPVYCGLSGRRGPAASARPCPELLTPDLHSRPVEWSAVRCRHRPGGRQRAVGGPGARQLLCRSTG